MKPRMIVNFDFFDWVSTRQMREGRLPTESEFRDAVQCCADRGFDTVHFRTSVCGKVCYPSKVMTPFTKDYRLRCNGLGGVMEAWDPLAVAVDACKKSGLAVLAWITLLDSYAIGLEDAFFARNPELLMRSCDGAHSMRGVPCYACEPTREYRLREAAEVSGYGVDGIFYSMHSHTCTARACGDPKGENIFGYNPEVVAAFSQRHGVNILEEDFAPHALYALQGEFLTQYLSEVRPILKAKGQYLCCTFSWEHDDGVHGTGRTMVNIGYAKGLADYPYQHMVGIHLDCEKWIRQDIVDGVAAQADHVDEILRVKQQAGGEGDFYVWIYCGFDEPNTTKRMDAIERVTAEALDQGLSGCAFHEEMSFELCPSLWNVVSRHGPRAPTE